MSISIACSACGKVYKLDDRFAGKRVKCNKCGSTFSVPAEVAGSEPEAPPPPPPPPMPEAEEHASSEAAGGWPGEHDEAGGSEESEQHFGGDFGGETDETSDAGAAFSHAATSAAPAPPAPPVPHVEPVRPPEATIARFAPASAPARSTTPRGGAPLGTAVVGVVYVLGVLIEVIGWAQMISVEVFGRRAEYFSSDSPEAASANALRSIRLQIHGGIYVIAGLLVLILGAVLHLRSGRGPGAHE